MMHAKLYPLLVIGYLQYSPMCGATANESFKAFNLATKNLQNNEIGSLVMFSNLRSIKMDVMKEPNAKSKAVSVSPLFIEKVKEELKNIKIGVKRMPVTLQSKIDISQESYYDLKKKKKVVGDFYPLYDIIQVLQGYKNYDLAMKEFDKEHLKVLIMAMNHHYTMNESFLEKKKNNDFRKAHEELLGQCASYLKTSGGQNEGTEDLQDLFLTQNFSIKIDNPSVSTQDYEFLD